MLTSSAVRKPALKMWDTLSMNRSTPSTRVCSTSNQCTSFPAHSAAICVQNVDPYLGIVTSVNFKVVKFHQYQWFLLIAVKCNTNTTYHLVSGGSCIYLCILLYMHYMVISSSWILIVQLLVWNCIYGLLNCIYFDHYYFVLQRYWHNRTCRWSHPTIANYSILILQRIRSCRQWLKTCRRTRRRCWIRERLLCEIRIGRRKNLRECKHRTEVGWLMWIFIIKLLIVSKLNLVFLW